MFYFKFYNNFQTIFKNKIEKRKIEIFTLIFAFLKLIMHIFWIIPNNYFI